MEMKWEEKKKEETFQGERCPRTIRVSMSRMKDTISGKSNRETITRSVALAGTFLEGYGYRKRSRTHSWEQHGPLTVTKFPLRQLPSSRASKLIALSSKTSIWTLMPIGLSEALMVTRSC